MEPPLVDTLVLAAVRRGSRHDTQIAGAARVPKRDVFRHCAVSSATGLVARRWLLYRVTPAGEEALLARGLELGGIDGSARAVTSLPRGAVSRAAMAGTCYRTCPVQPCPAGSTGRLATIDRWLRRRRRPTSTI